MSGERLLRIYLNDHRAGVVAAREVAKRSHAANRGTGVGHVLASFLRDLEEDAAALDEVMRRVGAPVDPVKAATTWVAEKVGRLKLNGRLFGYSDLSRLEELEFLGLAVEGKLSLWRTLQTLVARDRRLTDLDLPALIDRADRQRRELEEQRVLAARRAFLGAAVEPR